MKRYWRAIASRLTFLTPNGTKSQWLSISSLSDTTKEVLSIIAFSFIIFFCTGLIFWAIEEQYLINLQVNTRPLAENSYPLAIDTE